MASFHRERSFVTTPYGEKMQSLQPAHAPSPPPLDEHHTTALKLYSRAIRGYRHLLENGKATPVLTLLSCVLFICVEVIRDNIFGVVPLFMNGRNLLKMFESNIDEEKGHGGYLHGCIYFKIML